MTDKLDLIYTYNKVLSLLEKHGDTENCETDNCEICQEIESNRAKLSGKEYRSVKKRGYNRAVKKYIVINEFGKDKAFYNFKDVASYISACESSVRRILNTGKSHNGYTVDVEDSESD